MQAALGLDALRRDAGADDLRQAVDVDGLDPEPLLDLAPHLLGPGLGAEEADAQFDVLEAHLHLAGHVIDIEGKGRRGAQDRAAEIQHEHDLLLRVAAGDGDDRRADALRAVMGAQAAGEQAVPVGVLDDVLARRARGGERARHHIGPEVDIVPVVGDDRGLARGARGGMDADDVLEGFGEEPVGIVVAEIDFFREGKLDDIFDAFDVARLDALFVEGLLVERHAGIDTLAGFCQAFSLQFRKFRTGQ